MTDRHKEIKSRKSNKISQALHSSICFRPNQMVQRSILQSINEDDDQNTQPRSDFKPEYPISSDQLYKIWLRDGTMIGEGRTAIVCKVPFRGGWLALKMVDVFKHAENAIQELEDETNFLKKLKFEYPEG